MSGNPGSTKYSFNDAYSFVSGETSPGILLQNSSSNRNSTDCGSRMSEDFNACEGLFERLKVVQGRTAESLEILRSVTCKINARLMSHDKVIRQNTLDKLWLKSTGAIQILLSVLDGTKDPAASSYIASILRETLCLKQGKGKKCRVNNMSRMACATYIISINGTQIILKSIVAHNPKRDPSPGTDLLVQDLIWVLSTIAPKDPRFANKLRMLGAVRVIHYIAKNHLSDNKVIFPLLVIMKQLSKNSTTTSILVRDGVVATYEKILVSLGYIPTARLRLCLDAIDYFSKNKVFCAQMVKTGLCVGVMKVFDRWDRYEGRNRLKMCAHILQCLQHLCGLKSGRRALCSKKHVSALHRFCTNCPDEPEFDKLLARVCSVITLCLKHQCLPVAVNSPATFILPIAKDSNYSWPNEDDDELGGNSDSKVTSSDNEDDCLDTDIATDDELKRYDINLFPDKPEDIEKKYMPSSENTSAVFKPLERDVEDLKRYCGFFREFNTSKPKLPSTMCLKNPLAVVEDYFKQSILKKDNRSPSPPKALHHGNVNVANAPSYHSVTPSPSKSSLKLLKDLPSVTSFSSAYSIIASKVKSVIPFVKIAYPDLKGGNGLCIPEPLHELERTACRKKLLVCVDRALHPDKFMNEVVYDLDQSISDYQNKETHILTNNDELDIAKEALSIGQLEFESRFESGNLRKVIQISPNEFELILMPDVNSTKRHQWFYFEIRKMEEGRPYIFNIVNCEKSESQFNYGMKPVLYSVKEATLGRPGWVRAGTDICYYKNSYHYAGPKNANKFYLTVTFTITFPHSNDVCYIAYHFPYTYSMLMTKIWSYEKNKPSKVHFRAEPLCYTLNNNEVPVLTISAEDSSINPIVDREIIFLTARVHPGESNASWVMDGTLDFLLSTEPTAQELRLKYVFKLVPMLNAEGVINGCHRCGLTNEDLNRRWSHPSPILHPSIFHTKGLIEYLVRVCKKPPLVYCDYHGHSRKKNVFFYGCSVSESWCASDKSLTDNPISYLLLPALMHRLSPAFSLNSCSFRVERERESTARVTLWRHLGITRSYTMEASFCGFDQGPYKGYHLNTSHLQHVGVDICESLNNLNDATAIDIQVTRNVQGGKTIDSDGGSGSDSILKSDSDEEFD